MRSFRRPQRGLIIVRLPRSGTTCFPLLGVAVLSDEAVTAALFAAPTTTLGAVPSVDRETIACRRCPALTEVRRDHRRLAEAPAETVLLVVEVEKGTAGGKNITP